MEKSFLVDEKGFYGEFGGAYVPEILYATVQKLQEEYLPIIESEAFKKEYMELLRDYVGRPSPLYYAKRMSDKYGCQLYLKREDLNHTGAHKINNTIGQILLAKKMGKKNALLLRQEQDNTVWRQLRSVHLWTCPAWSIREHSTWSVSTRMWSG